MNLSLEKFLSLVKETLEIENQDIEANDQFRDYEEWDSLAALSILAMINQEFDVIISRIEFDQIRTIKEIFEFVNDKFIGD
jgi:acyl carrier protein